MRLPNSAKHVCLVAIVLTLSFRVILPQLNSRQPSGHDVLNYIARLSEFQENVRHGNLLPRWAPDLGKGNGQPIFFFAPPAIYYLGSFWNLIGFDIATAMDLAAALIVIASVCFMFLFCRLLFGNAGGWLGAAAYLYSPYFHVNLYVRRALAEFAAFPFYPATLYAFTRYARNGDRRFLILGSAFYAAILLSHNPSALMFTPVLLSYAAFQAWQGQSWKLLFHQLAGMALGLALSAFFWVPSLLDMKNVHIDRVVAGYYDYSHHFVLFHQFFSRMWGYGGSIPGPDDDMSFSLGWSHLLVGAIAIALVFYRGKADSRRYQVFFGCTVIALCALMTPASAFIWKIAPMLHYVQFPWRLLGPACFSLAVLVSAAGSVLPAIESRRLFFGFALVLLLVVPNWRHPRPRFYFDVNLSEWTPQAIAQRGVDTTAVGEYEPLGVQTSPPYSEDRWRVVSGMGSIGAIHVEPTRWSADLSMREAGVVEARLFYFPGWEAEIDRKRAQVSTEPVSGRIQFPVPAGNHSVTLSFRRTWPRLLAEIVSAVSLFVAIILCSVSPYLSRRNARSRS